MFILLSMVLAIELKRKVAIVFTDDEDVINEVSSLMVIFQIFNVFSATQVYLSGAFYGLGK